MRKDRFKLNRFNSKASKWKTPRGVALVMLLCMVSALTPATSSAIAAGSITFTQTNLVSDLPGVAQITDPNLVNPWGLTLGLNSGLWVSENGAS